ncbi:MAG TPA: hypothetical protein VMZ69_06310, partial [Saprospiraceae bacterium]|nr:hypothetical protein [Saprospiraceae bacterium]
MNKLRAFMTSIFFLAAFYGDIHGQMDIVVTGGDAVGSGGSAAYSVGQVAYINMTTEAGLISLGVQQPNLFLTVDTDEPEFTISASAFPNPVNDNIN